MAKSTILVVDKEKILVDLLTRALSSDDATAYGATSCDEARALMAMHSPGIVVVDASVPDAYTLLDAASKEGAKVLGVSGSLEETTLLNNAGVGNQVDRSAGFEALLGAIRKLHDAPLKILGQDSSVHVLIADDEEELRNVLSEFLKMKGYTVRTAPNGFDAVQIINQDPAVQAVLLDVSMPQMGGMEALRFIMDRANPPSVIMMTAVADRDVARQAMKAGAFDYILKPFDFMSIDASIMACLSQKEFKKQPWWKRLTRRTQ